MGTMEVDRVLRLIQLLSDKCSFKGVELSVTATQLKEELKTVQRVGGRLSELASLAEGLFVQGALEEGSQNCTGGEVLASLDGNSTGAWFSIQMGDSKFQNLEGVGVAFGILCTVLFLPLIISCLVQLAQKRRISQIAQVSPIYFWYNEHFNTIVRWFITLPLFPGKLPPIGHTGRDFAWSACLILQPQGNESTT